MADASISVAVGADVTAYERGMQKASDMGRKFSRSFADSTSAASRASVNNYGKIKTAMQDLIPAADAATGGMVSSFIRAASLIKSGPILGAVAVVSSAIGMLASKSEETQDRIGKSFGQIVVYAKDAQTKLRAAFPSIFGAKSDKDRISMTAEEFARSGNVSGAREAANIATQNAQGNREALKKEYAVLQSVLAASARERDLTEKMKSPITNDLGKAIEVDMPGGGRGYLTNKEFMREFDPSGQKGGRMTPMAVEIKQLREQIAAAGGIDYVRANVAKYSDGAQIADFAAAKYTEATAQAEKTSAAAQQERDRLARSASEAAAKDMADRSALTTSAIESDRALRIATAPSEDAQNRLRQQFIREDFGAARERRGAAVSAGRTDEATREAIEMRKLMVEFVTLQKEVAKNTKGGARL